MHATATITTVPRANDARLWLVVAQRDEPRTGGACPALTAGCAWVATTPAAALDLLLRLELEPVA